MFTDFYMINRLDSITPDQSNLEVMAMKKYII